jgi:nicotinamide phosphoribosyltransferase
MKVELVEGEYSFIDQVTEQEERDGELQIIYEDGNFKNETNLKEIRDRINKSL